MNEFPKDPKKKPMKKERCFICGRSENLTRTLCCNRSICDDSHEYVMFSYAHNSCFRNHDRYTLCSYHHHEEHEGEWQTCKKCMEDLDTEMYVYFGTNEYNFEVLKNPPEYEPTRCAKCGKIIRRGRDAHTTKGGNYYCAECIKIRV